MDSHEQDDLRAFLVELFQEKAEEWPMNDRIFNLVYELVSESTKCSKAMDYVPRPVPPGMEPFKWLGREARRAFIRRLKTGKEHYKICLSAAAYRMVRRFELAALGL